MRPTEDAAVADQYLILIVKEQGVHLVNAELGRAGALILVMPQATPRAHGIQVVNEKWLQDLRDEPKQAFAYQ